MYLLIPLKEWEERTANETVRAVTLPMERLNAVVGETIELTTDFAVRWDDENTLYYVRLNAVSGRYTLEIDGETVGAGESLYTGAVFDVTQAIKRKPQRLTLRITPEFTPDGFFSFGSAVLCGVGESHFEFGRPDQGLSVRTLWEDGETKLELSAPVTRPNNYDVLIFRLYANGLPVAEKTVKPTAPAARLTVRPDLLWDGAHAPQLRVAAILRRDAEELDRVEREYGVRHVRISEDGFFRINDVRQPLSGVGIPLPRRLESDLEVLSALESNFVVLPYFEPATENELYLCDFSGLHVMVDLAETDLGYGELEKLLTVLTRHPSVCFLRLKQGDDEQRRRFCETVAASAPGILPVLACDLPDIEEADAAGTSEEAADLSGSSAVWCISVEAPDSPETAYLLRRRFEAAQKKHPGSFLVFAHPPAPGCLPGSYEARGHEALWQLFGGQKSVIGYIAGALYDTIPAENGLIGADRTTRSDAYWFYRVQFSDRKTIKLLTLPDAVDDRQKIDVICYTNAPPVKLTVNGKEKKRVHCTRLARGVYCFAGLRPEKGENEITVRAGELSDTAKVTR
ncbi:MAG: hypothetical protein IJJ85_08205 [Clostridia bacterium]|nr:hypothetical protein [Clostridia bacterium]